MFTLRKCNSKGMIRIACDAQAMQSSAGGRALKQALS